MKKFIKTSLKVFAVLATILIILLGLIIWQDYRQRFTKDGGIIVVVEGNSNYPTLANGQKVILYERAPEINDFVAIASNRPDFYEYQGVNPDDKNVKIIKRLKKINEQGCYWVEGDNQSTPESSYDSIDYGWICPSDLTEPIKVAVPM